MKTLSRLWHSLTCGCHKNDDRHLWRGWSRLLFPLMMAAALGWFLVRVIPKPIRATYPCQQAAFPIASACILWLLALKASLVAFWRNNMPKLRPALLVGVIITACGLVALIAGEASRPSSPSAGGKIPWVPSDPPNSPMGEAKGIFPGRVVWIRDTSATPWHGNTNVGHWWDNDTGINQSAVDRMTSRSLQSLTGATTDAAAWDKVFRYYNSAHNRGNTGYKAGEIIALKPNCNNAYAGYGDDDNQVDASPQAILAMLRQLVNEAKVPQNNIVVYEAVRVIHDHIYRPCHQEFPGVLWVDSKANETNGRLPVLWQTNAFHYSVTVSNACGTSIPKVVRDSTYIINMALLKGHPTTGVTLTAKNHYGSINGRDHREYVNTWQHAMGTYNPFVDIMGSKELGGKTLLYMIDGLYGTRCANDPICADWAGWKNLFDGQWSASLFMSLDPVAIDSVGLDFLRSEFSPSFNLSRQAGHDVNADNYLHEAAKAGAPPSGTVYQPDGIRLSSLGTHEHWNNPRDKQYSRNLTPTGTGIELIALQGQAPVPRQAQAK